MSNKKDSDYLRSTPPRCVRALRLAPAELPDLRDESFKTVWRLSCNCGGETGAVLGHPLNRINIGYDGPAVFVGPLAFECSSCSIATEILDTDLHGYHCEVARLEGGKGGVKYRGEGQRDRFSCSYCRAHWFKLIVAFVYWDAAFDLAEDEPEIALEDFFNALLSYGFCANCGKASSITDFGKL